MSDLNDTDQLMDEPQGLSDPGDMLNPDIEEEHSPNAQIGNPTGDPDAEDSDNPADQPRPDNDPALEVDINDDVDDDDSELDELDEAQFDNFDPDAANIVVPIAIDESNVGQLGVHKRKRTEEEERERKKKKKEGRRVRESKRPKKRTEGDEDAETGRVRAPRRAATPEDEEALSPEERRRRALERKMDEALRTNKPVRRKGGIDLQDMGEEELNVMRNRMAKAAQLDNEARKRNEPASDKLKILPQVVELLNRNTLRSAILDPDINVLEAVRFFLEPADEDAALPNYQIQREMFAVLSKLRMTKEALIASGIGKVVMYYTKSNQPQPAIKRQAEKLIQGWMSVVLNRKPGKSRQIETREFDPIAASQRVATQDRSALLEEKRRRALQAPAPGNRARIEGGLGTYTIAPRNTYVNGTQVQKGGDDAFKKLAARAQAKAARR